jgi:hypothetical protein
MLEIRLTRSNPRHLIKYKVAQLDQKIEQAKTLPRKAKRKMRNEALLGKAKLKVLDDIMLAKNWAERTEPVYRHCELARSIPYPRQAWKEPVELFIGSAPPPRKVRKYPKEPPKQRPLDEVVPVDPMLFFGDWLKFVESKETVKNDSDNDIGER